MEWTVPFEYGFFHVGVHNLPKENAVELTKTLIDYSFSENPTNERLHELFAMLKDIPQVLVILNHPRSPRSTWAASFSERDWQVP